MYKKGYSSESESIYQVGGRYHVNQIYDYVPGNSNSQCMIWFKMNNGKLWIQKWIQKWEGPKDSFWGGSVSTIQFLR